MPTRAVRGEETRDRPSWIPNPVAGMRKERHESSMSNPKRGAMSIRVRGEDRPGGQPPRAVLGRLGDSEPQEGPKDETHQHLQ